MSLDGNKDVRFIVLAVCFLMSIIVIAMIIDFKVTYVFYGAGCIIFLVRYLYLRFTL